MKKIFYPILTVSLIALVFGCGGKGVRSCSSTDNVEPTDTDNVITGSGPQTCDTVFVDTIKMKVEYFVDCLLESHCITIDGDIMYKVLPGTQEKLEDSLTLILVEPKYPNGRGDTSDEARANSGSTDAGVSSDNKSNSDSSTSYVLVVIVLGVCILVVFVLYKSITSRLKSLSYDLSDMRKTVDSLGVKYKTQSSSSQAVSQKNKVVGAMSDEDRQFVTGQIAEIKKYVGDQIVKYMTPTTQSSSNKVMSLATKPVVGDEVAIDTDDVMYNPNDNSFSLKQTDLKIFRVFSRNGEYYYTIVDNPAVRREMTGLIQSFQNCISYIVTGHESVSIEPVTEGKLRKDGNKFYVVSKLKVKFV